MDSVAEFVACDSVFMEDVAMYRIILVSPFDFPDIHKHVDVILKKEFVVFSAIKSIFDIILRQ